MPRREPGPTFNRPSDKKRIEPPLERAKLHRGQILGSYHNSDHTWSYFFLLICFMWIKSSDPWPWTSLIAQQVKILCSIELDQRSPGVREIKKTPFSGSGPPFGPTTALKLTPFLPPFLPSILTLNRGGGEFRLFMEAAELSQSQLGDRHCNAMGT